VKTRLELPIAIILGALVPLALSAAGTAEAVADALAIIEDLHIAEFAAAANALAIVP
jgi:hypothetical protein